MVPGGRVWGIWRSVYRKGMRSFAGGTFPAAILTFSDRKGFFPFMLSGVKGMCL